MTREEIQKELDSLKGTRFDKSPDKFLHFLESTSKKCPYCGKAIIGSMTRTHIESCRKDELIIADIISKNSRSVSIRQILVSHGIGETTTPGKRIQDKLRERGFVSQSVKRVSHLEDPFLRVIKTDPNLTKAELSRLFKCDERLIERLAQRTGVVLNQRIKSERLAMQETILQMFKKGMTKSQIAREIGYKAVTVGRILKREGL